MCILFCYIANETNETGYELILLSNRDEDFQRPAIQAHVWKDTIYAIGGWQTNEFDEMNVFVCFLSKDKIKLPHEKVEHGYV